MEPSTIQMTNTIIQYDCNFIMSIRNQVSNRLPVTIYNKIIGYQKNNFKSNRMKKSGSGSGFGPRSNYSENKMNRFVLSRNPDQIDTEEIKVQVSKEMTSILNKVTNRNLDAMKDKINHVIELVNKIRVKTEIHKLLMSQLLNKAVCEKSWANVYASILTEISPKIELDYRDYLDNLFVDIKKSNVDDFSKDYNTFCKQIADKDKFIGLFSFIGELHKLKLLEDVLIKKYIMVLLNNMGGNVTKTEMETNAQSIKCLLQICKDTKFYDLVYPKFMIMKSDKQYHMKLRFILMDITEMYEKGERLKR